MQLLHCLGKFVGCYWPKVRNLAFQVIVLDLEVSIDFGPRDWFISRIMPLYFFGLEDDPLLPSVETFYSSPSYGRHRWELPVNYPIFTVGMVTYHYVERIWRILVTPNVLYNIYDHEKILPIRTS